VLIFSSSFSPSFFLSLLVSLESTAMLRLTEYFNGRAWIIDVIF